MNNKTLDNILQELLQLNKDVCSLSGDILEIKFFIIKGSKFKQFEKNLLDLKTKLSQIDEYISNNFTLNGNINELEYRSYQLKIVSSQRNMCESSLINGEKLLNNINQDCQNRFTSIIAIISLIISTIAIWD